MSVDGLSLFLGFRVTSPLPCEQFGVGETNCSQGTSPSGILINFFLGERPVVLFLVIQNGTSADGRARLL